MLLSETPADIRRALASVLLDRLADAAPTEGGLPGQLVCLDPDKRLDYHLGLLDILATLGVVELTADGLAARVVSSAGGWALRLLNDLLDAPGTLVGDWHAVGITPPEKLKHPFAKAPDLLAALDRRRRELLPGSAPVRTVEAAVALIGRRDTTGELHFLLVYDSDARAWQLPGGRRDHDDASLHDTLVRELGEELGWNDIRGSDHLLLHELSHLSVTRESPTFGLRTRTVFAPFLVLLRHELPVRGTQVRWLSLAEIRTGTCADGKTISAGPLVQLWDHPELNLEGLFDTLQRRLGANLPEKIYNETP